MLRFCGYFLEYGGQRDLAQICRAALPYTGWAGFVPAHNPPGQFRELLRLGREAASACTPWPRRNCNWKRC